MRNPKEKEKLIFNKKQDQVDFMDKIMKNKESKEMGLENKKGLEKDEDQLLLEGWQKQDRHMDEVE